MSMKILVAENNDMKMDLDNDTNLPYEIVAVVSSLDEAREFAAEYLVNGPDNDRLPPTDFWMIEQDYNGFFTKRTHIVA